MIFDQSDQFLDDNDARTNWYMYDTLNDPKHAQSASIAMAKLFPNMSGYRVNMIKVQQQEGVNDCGLFACAYISLLSNGQDPSQHTFDQRLLRLSFRRFLEGDDIPYFCPINAKSQIEITTVEIDWGFKYEEKYADLIEQYRKNLSKDTGKEPFITL
jgi:hypothetical protein